MSTQRVLIADDELDFRQAVSELLRARGYQVEETGSCQETRQRLRTAPPDVAVLDYQLPDGTALELLRETQSLVPSVPVVILTGNGSIDRAVRAIKEGADQFLTKPVEISALLVLVERLVERRRRLQSELVSQSRRRPGRDPFCGKSEAIRRLAEEASRVLDSESPVLVLGETGVGKGILARWLHGHSAPRRPREHALQEAQTLRHRPPRLSLIENPPLGSRKIRFKTPFSGFYEKRSKAFTAHGHAYRRRRESCRWHGSCWG